MKRLHLAWPLVPILAVLTCQPLNAQTRTLGTNYEQTVPTTSGALSVFTTTSLQLVSGTAHTFTHPSNPSGSFYYWSASAGSIEPVSGYANYSRATLVAPTVTQATDVVLYTLVGDGAGHAAEQSVVITVTPAGGITEDVTITSNLSGQVWAKDSVHLISWSGSVSGYVRIYLYRGGIRQNSIGRVPASEGQFEWTVPRNLVLGSGYQIWIESDSSGAVTDTSGYFSIAPLSDTYVDGIDLVVDSVTMLPSSLLVGEPITYRCVVRNRGRTANDRQFRVGFYRSDDDRFDPGTDVHMATIHHRYVPPGTTIQLETSHALPLATPQGTHYILAVVDDQSEVFEEEENNNVGSTTLQVQVNDRMNVVTPAGGEQFRQGGLLNTTWASNRGGNVRIELMKSLSVERVMASSTTNDGAFTWTIPHDLDFQPSSYSNYSVRITSLSDETALDSSEQFSILDGHDFQVALPEAEDSYQIGTSYTVNWSDTYDGSFRLELYKGGRFVERVAESVPSPGSGAVQFEWFIGTHLEAGSGYTMRFTLIEDPTVSSLEGPFTLLPHSNHPPVARDDVVSTDANVSLMIVPLINDSDHDDDPFDVTTFSQPSYGEVSYDSITRSFSYIPMTDFSGEDTFEYQISDAFGLGIAQVTIIVNPPSDLVDHDLQRAGGSNDDFAEDLKVAPDGSIYVTGSFRGQATFGKGANAQVIASDATSDFFLAKYDADWSLQWVRVGDTPTVGKTSYGTALDIDIAGNVYLAGLFDSTLILGPNSYTSRGETDIFVAKYSADGTFLWSRQEGGVGVEYAQGLELSGSGVFVAGTFSGSATIGSSNMTSFGSSDAFLLHLSESGTPAWTKTGGSTAGTQVYGIGTDDSGNCYLVGACIGDLQFGGELLSSGGSWWFIVTHASNGTQTGMTKVADLQSGITFISDVSTDANGNTYVGGNHNSSIMFSPGDTSIHLPTDGGDTAFVARIAPAGQVEWAHSLGGDGRQLAYGVSANDSGVLVCGYFEQECIAGHASLPYRRLTTDRSGASWIAAISADGDYQMAQVVSGLSASSEVIAGSIAWVGNDQMAFAGEFREQVSLGKGAGQTMTLSLGQRDIFLAECPVTLEDPVNASPYLADDTATASSGVPLVIDVRSNDYDEEGNPLVITSTTQPGIGSVSIDQGKILFSTAADEDGLAQFEYAVSDGVQSSTAQVSVLVRPIPDTYLEVLQAGAQSGSESIETRGLDVDSSGNTYICGSFRGTVQFQGGGSRTSLGDNDGFIAKYAPDGSVVWTTTIRGTGSQVAQRIALGPDGHVYLAGYLNESYASIFGEGTPQNVGAGYRGFIASLDSSGAMRWVRPIQVTAQNPNAPSDFYCTGFGVDSNNDIYASGWCAGDIQVGTLFDPELTFQQQGQTLANSSSDGIVIKINSSGQALWLNRISSGTEATRYNHSDRSYYGGLGANGAYHLAVDIAGPIVIGGQSFNNQAVVIQYSASGTVGWVASPESVRGLYFRDTDQTLLVATGTSMMSINDATGAVSSSIPLSIVPNPVGVDSDGNTIGVAQLTQVNLAIMIGQTEYVFSTAGGYDMLVMKLTASGEIVAANQLGSVGNDYFRDGRLLPNGELAVAGTYGGPLGLGSTLPPLIWMGGSDGFWLRAKPEAPTADASTLSIVTRKTGELAHSLVAYGSPASYLAVDSSIDGLFWRREHFKEPFEGVYSFAAGDLSYNQERHYRVMTEDQTAITIILENNPSGEMPFQGWSRRFALSIDHSGLLDSPANDGVTNLEKYAFNMDPHRPTSAHIDEGDGNSGMPLAKAAEHQSLVDENLGTGVNSPAAETNPTLSRNGLTLYFQSNRAGGAGSSDIYMATRATTSAPFGTPSLLAGDVNLPASDGGPSISADGLSLYFHSNRVGGFGVSDLYVATRSNEIEAFGKPVNLGPGVNTVNDEFGPSVTSDGLSIYFQRRNDANGYGGDDIWVATRSTTNEMFGEATNLGPTVNTALAERVPAISDDELSIFFASSRVGGLGADDLYVARRRSVNDPFSPAESLRSDFNSPSTEFSPALERTGEFFFASNRPEGSGNNDIYVVRPKTKLRLEFLRRRDDPNLVYIPQFSSDLGVGDGSPGWKNYFGPEHVTPVDATVEKVVVEYPISAFEPDQFFGRIMIHYNESP